MKNCEKYQYKLNLFSSSHLHILRSRKISFMLRNDCATFTRIETEELRNQLKIYVHIKHTLTLISQYSSLKHCYENLNIKSILQQLNETNSHERAWRNDENTQSARAHICLNVSQLFCIKTIIAIDHETIIKIDQSETQNYKQCENVEFDEFSTIYDDLNKSRSASILLNWIVFRTKIEEWWEIFIQIKSAFVLIFQRSSITKNLFHVSKQLHNLHTNRLWKVRRATENTNTNQSCFWFHIFTFLHRFWFYQADKRLSINLRLFYVSFFEVVSIMMNFLNRQ